MRVWSQGIPRHSMRLYLNAWFSTWPEDRELLTDQFVLIDQVRYAGQ